MSQLGITLGSKAMWGTWCMHHPSRTLFDCGLGAVRHLESRIFAVELVAITHDDMDHWTDLIALVGLRAKTKGATSKPLEVLYPYDSWRMVEAIKLIRRINPPLPYTLTFTPIEAGFTRQISRTTCLEAFAMQHRRSSTLGYRFTEERKRLTPTWAAIVRQPAETFAPLSVGEMLRAARERGDPVDETYRGTPFVFATDHHHLDPADIEGAALCVMDCTFLRAADRHDDDPGHATLDESARLCAAAHVKHMVAAHISSRYDPADVMIRAVELSDELGMPITVCHPDLTLTL